MAKEKAPAMSFYGREFYDDENVLLMNLEQQGAYVRLLWKCWSEGSIPGDTEKLAAILGLARGRFEGLWPRLKVCFIERGDRLVHNKIETLRDEKNARRDASKAAANKRWGSKQQYGDDATALPSHQSGNAFRIPNSELHKPHTPSAPAPESSDAEILAGALIECRETLHDPGDGDFALQILLGMISRGEVTKADAPLLVPGMRKWKRCADWVDRKPEMLPKTSSSKLFYFSLAEWVRARAWRIKPTPCAEDAQNSEEREYKSAPKDWPGLPGATA